MRSKLVHLLLLFALSINIAHDTIIAVGEQHVTESISEYIQEQSQSSECGNMGESHHHLFHFSAIFVSLQLCFNPLTNISVIDYSTTVRPILLPDTKIKPPIA